MRFAGFQDGLWVVEAGQEYQVPANALTQADNVEFLQDGSVRGRRGVLKYNSSAESGAIKGMWRHYPRTGTAKLLVATDVGSTVTLRVGDDGAGTFANVTSGTGLTDAYHYFANWPAKNKTFITNGTDEMKEYDGSTLATTASGTAKKGPYLTVHKSRLWATDPSELTHSVYASDVNDEDTWDAASHLSVNDPQGGTIKGLASFMDFLVILKDTSLFRFTGDISTTVGAQLALYSDIGCVAPNTVSVSPYGIFFLAKDGLYLTDGVNPVPDEMSRPIRPLFRARATNTTYASAVGAWDPYRQRYVLTLDPSASTGYILQRVPLLTENPFTGERTRVAWCWSKHTNLAANAMVAWDGAGDSGQFLIGSQDGFVRYTDTGTQDDGVAIAAVIKTASRLMDKDGRTGRVYRAKVNHRAAVTLSGELYYDNEAAADTTFTIGAAETVTNKYSRTTLTDFADQGRFVACKLTNASDSYNFELSWIDLDVRWRSARVWR